MRVPRSTQRPHFDSASDSTNLECQRGMLDLAFAPHRDVSRLPPVRADSKLFRSFHISNGDLNWLGRATVL